MEINRQLDELLKFLHIKKVEGQTSIPVRGMAYHSDRVQPGFIFFCLEGTRNDGHEFIDQAIAAGAIAVVLQKEREIKGAVNIIVPDVRMAMAVLSEVFYDSPSQKLRLIGITGTNGKTTTAHLIDAILSAQNHTTGILGTIKYMVGQERLPVLATTPEAPDLQRMFNYMLKKNVEYAVIEVSSHALELNRVAGSDFDIAVLTNVTEDHLDFHLTFERYLHSKGKLFSQLGGSFLKGELPRYAVLNHDDPHYSYFVRQTTVQTLSYGLEEKADIKAENVVIRDGGVSYEVSCPWGKEGFNLKLAGYFSVYNALAATSVALLEGIPLSTIKESLENVIGVPGRFERIDLGQNFHVIVDYAHTPDGLENILQTAAEIVRGKLITIFGCGGERDRSKRLLMGRIASIYSDYCILTTDNPRGEDPWQIIREVEAGLQEGKNLGSGYVVQADRYEAIRLGIELARPGDMVIIAGKGHENYQIFSDYIIPFDDRAVASEIINKRLINQC
jgi:UDP-N-acetylmuramoyl-L-alanyl-D-glutamate--2,6-diaminopimelate ligase